jgi:hypothetical protein
MYGGLCYKACPSGWVRTAVCSCERKGWKKRLWKDIERDATRVIKAAGPAMATAWSEFSRLTSSSAKRLKRLVERESQKAVKPLVKTAKQQTRRILGISMKQLNSIVTGAARNRSQTLRSIRDNSTSRAALWQKLKSQASSFRKEFSLSRIRNMRRGKPTSLALKSAAKDVFKASKRALVIQVAASVGTVLSWAAITCARKHPHGSLAYNRCFQAEAIEGFKVSSFQTLVAIAYVPIEIKIVTPISLKLAITVTALVAAATGGLGAVAIGTIVAIVSKIATSIAVMQEADRLFPYYEQHLWNRGSRLELQLRRIIFQAGKDLMHPVFRPLFREVYGKASGVIGRRPTHRPQPRSLPRTGQRCTSNNRCARGNWCHGREKRCYEMCVGTALRGGNHIPRRNRYFCNYGREGKSVQPRNIERHKIGKRCPCGRGSWCGSDGRCYETCYSTGTRGGNRIPRKNRYFCDYGRETPYHE